jgi:hypothetical protein
MATSLIVSLLTVLLTLAGSTQAAATKIRCPEFINDLYTDADILHRFKVALTPGAEAPAVIESSCAEILMRHGFYEALEYLIDSYYIPNKIDIVDDLKTTSYQVLKTLEKFSSLSVNY